MYISSRSAKDCAATEKELNAFGPGTCIAIPADMQKLEQVDHLVSELSKREKALHVLVNNAGAAWGDTLDEYPVRRVPIPIYISVSSGGRRSSAPISFASARTPRGRSSSRSTSNASSTSPRGACHSSARPRSRADEKTAPGETPRGSSTYVLCTTLRLRWPPDQGASRGVALTETMSLPPSSVPSRALPCPSTRRTPTPRAKPVCTTSAAISPGGSASKASPVTHSRAVPSRVKVISSLSRLPLPVVDSPYFVVMAQTLREQGEIIKARIPLGRIGTPEDVAGACIFLASRAGAFVNGATIAVDGGSVVRMDAMAPKL